jgi:hypothetical protein
MDTYGHLVQGSEANAVARLSDAFALPPKSQQLGIEIGRNSANQCEMGKSENSGFPNENTAKTSRASRIRTYDLRIRNPLLYPTEL